MNLITLFVVLNIINVILQTAKSIATVKCGKLMASVVNALAYGVYTYVIIYTSIDGITMFYKALIVALCNLVGVYAVKFCEEKFHRDRLWKIEFTTNNALVDREKVEWQLEQNKIPFTPLVAGRHTVFNCYCSTSEQSIIVKNIIKTYNGKYFASETKIL